MAGEVPQDGVQRLFVAVIAMESHGAALLDRDHQLALRVEASQRVDRAGSETTAQNSHRVQTCKKIKIRDGK